MGWRFFANRLDGDGTETCLHPELPVTSCSITEALSAPMLLEVGLRPESVPMSIFVPWSTAIYAEEDGVIRAAGIIPVEDGVVSADSELAVSATGWSAYLDGMPWANKAKSYIEKDPGHIIPVIWATVQRHRAGNIGLVVPKITTGETVGTPTTYKYVEKGAAGHKKSVKVVDEKAEPFLLARYATADLGASMATLLQEGRIDYREYHRWVGQDIEHKLVMASPRLGRRLSDLRCVIGENVTMVPQVTPAEYASEVVVLGAGDGTKKIIHRSVNPKPPRLRRAVVVNDETVRRKAGAEKRADRLLKLLGGTADDISQVVVHDGPSARIGALTVGDEFRLSGPAGWAGDVDVWLRIVAREWNPIDAPDQVTLTVARADKVAA